MERLLIDETSLQQRKVSAMLLGLIVMMSYTVNPEETKQILTDCGVKYKEEEKGVN